MRILSVDPGAERCGIAVIDSDPLSYVHSEIIRVPREIPEYQQYRLELIRIWTLAHGMRLLQFYNPDVLVNEIVPIRGGNFGAMAQMNLAATVITTLQSLAFSAKIEVKQLSAITVKMKIGGSKRATKVKVRNGVYSLLPETRNLTENNWSKVFDESDALAVGLCYLNYDTRKLNGSNKKEKGSSIRTNTAT